MLNLFIDMYGKCGRMDLVYEVFFKMDERNVSSWILMIVGYVMDGYVSEVMECFYGMIEVGVMFNYVIFIGVLSVCVYGGMVDEGKRCFEMMKKFYRIEF